MLEYQVPQPRSSASVALSLLIALLPVVAAGSAMFSAANWVGEPFGSVEPRDVLLFGGAPVVVLACGIAWCWAARSRRAGWPVCLLAAAWFSLMLYCSMASLLPYFREPWNR